MAQYARDIPVKMNNIFAASVYILKPYPERF
ncbi:hypothetical protein ESCOMM100M1_21765 [Escherichia coli]